MKDAPNAQEAKKTVQSTVVEKSGPGEIYICKKGDTYTSIAKKHGITVKELKDLNSLKGEQIDDGMELKVDLKGDYSEYDKKFYTLSKDDKKWAEIAKKLKWNLLIWRNWTKELVRMNSTGKKILHREVATWFWQRRLCTSCGGTPLFYPYE